MCTIGVGGGNLQKRVQSAVTQIAACSAAGRQGFVRLANALPGASGARVLGKETVRLLKSAACQEPVAKLRRPSSEPKAQRVKRRISLT
jgi:hypothetical protein